ncbi:MAG: FAD-dependent oxidoreductase, partial [Terriglobia bacterium]
MATYDAVIVGSGFGGAVAACRLAEQGRSVLVLERGRRWGRKDFPRTGQADAPWRFQNDRTGLFEIRRFPGMKVIVAAGVGGGSLVYTNVQKVPPASAFKGWPEPISLPRLRPYYERVRAMLEPTPIPHPLQRLRAFEAAHAEAERVRPAELQGRVERPSLAVRWGEGDQEVANRFGARQQPCNLCGNCALGCERHSKNTLDLTYLKRAQDLGALVWPLCQVTRIAPARLGGPTGTVYEVCFRRRGEENEGEEKVRARSVYLAAGSLGTTELLLRCRDRERTLPKLSPRLGHQWSANGDFFAGLLDARLAIEPTRGPSVAAAYDAAEHGGFYVLEGAIPPALLEGRRRALGWLTGAVSALRLSYRRPPSAAAEAE